MNRRDFCKRIGVIGITPPIVRSFDKGKITSRREILDVIDYPSTLTAYFWHMETGDGQQECVWEDYEWKRDRGELQEWKESLKPLDYWQIEKVESILDYWSWFHSGMNPVGFSEDHHQHIPNCLDNLADEWLTDTFASGIKVSELRQFCIDMIGPEDYQEEGGDREFYRRYSNYTFREEEGGSGLFFPWKN